MTSLAVPVACLMAACLAACGGPGGGTVTPAGEATSAVPPSTAKEAGSMILTSPAFEQGEAMPSTFAYSGANLSPPLEWAGAPPGTKSFALACVDLHPVAHGWVHWVVVDLPAGTSSLAEGASRRDMPAGSRELATSYGAGSGWGGPHPPPGSGAHTYRFTLYALDVARLDLPDGADLKAAVSAMNGHVVETATLEGTFER